MPVSTRMRRLARALLTVLCAAALSFLATAPASAALPGSVYTMTNEPAGNSIVVFNRGATGTLTQAATVPTGSNGARNSPPFNADHLDSQGGVELSDSGHLLFAVNAGSDTLSSFRVLPGGSVQLVNVVPTGDYPISVDSHADIVYVLNEGELGPTDDATEGTIQGYVAASNGQLTPIANSVEPLSVTGSEAAVSAQIAFDKTGRTLTVTHRAPVPDGAPLAPSRIDTFVLNADGTPGPAVVNIATGDVAGEFVPFGFAFTPTNQLIVTNAFGPSISSYDINTTTGALTFIAGGNTTVAGTVAPCWIAITPDGKFAFVGNTGSDDITRLSIAADGKTTVLAGGPTALPGNGAAADVVLSPDGRFLTVLSVIGANLGPPDGPDTSQTDTFAVGTDGSLTLLNPGGATNADLASGVTGLAASAPDSTPPDTVFTSGPAEGSSTNDRTPSFGLGTVPATEPNPTFTCKVDGGAEVACTSPFTPASLADGSHTVAVAATDFGGNTDATPVTRTFVVDTIAPETTIVAGPRNGGSTSDTTPTFRFASSEAGSSFRCRVDTAAFAACTTPFTTRTLTRRSHTFSVAATDAAGNLDATPATRRFTVKRAQPGCTRLAGTQRVGTNARNTIRGGPGVDIIFGLGANDILLGFGNRDCLYGGTGNDRLSGGAGADRLFGEVGSDRITGGAGADSLIGAGGADRLTDVSGKDTFSAGAGNDRVNARDSARSGRRIRDTVRCGAGRDVALVDRRDTVARDCERVSRR